MKTFVHPRHPLSTLSCYGALEIVCIIIIIIIIIILLQAGVQCFSFRVNAFVEPDNVCISDGRLFHVVADDTERTDPDSRSCLPH